MIFYFSATGNSASVAEKLQKQFPGELISVTDAIRNRNFIYEAKKGEKILFVFPVYFWNMPRSICEFLADVTLCGDLSGIGAVITCGGQILGADAAFRRAVQKRGLSVQAVYFLKMPDNCVNYFKISDAETQLALLRSADRRLEEIAENIQSGFRNGYRAGAAGRFWSRLCLPVYRSQRRTKKYWVQDHCTGCGLCSAICPSDAICMQNGKPVWIKDSCVWCQGCINRCPETAIQYGNKTENRGRYVHPAWK